MLDRSSQGYRPQIGKPVNKEAMMQKCIEFNTCRKERARTKQTDEAIERADSIVHPTAEFASPGFLPVDALQGSSDVDKGPH
jgi:hypothetical protein